MTASEAILDLLRRHNTAPFSAVCIFSIGRELIGHFSERDILNSLIFLESRGVFDFVSGNKLKLVKPLPELGDPVEVGCR